MTSAKRRKTDFDLVRALREFQGVTAVSLPAGQVVAYRGHYAPGVYLLVQGTLELLMETNGGEPATRVLDARDGAVAVPDPERFHEPLPWTVSVKKPSRLLFVPRSILFHDDDVRRILESAALSRSI
ncbi:MAG: cyclic nucleotide-binding domain-containing protein [Deltaproteobacteria bacterium]|nr:cyclic nucleotide-binding domain-containing protein [Deltaproteobacteria bacterium]